MRQLRQRVSIRSELAPLALADVKPYISRRLLIAGNDGRVQFTGAATEIIAAASDGIPRVINLVCDRALLRAARSRTTTVDVEHILWAVDDLQLEVDLPLATPASPSVSAEAPPLPQIVVEPPAQVPPPVVAESPTSVVPPMVVESPTMSEPTLGADRFEIRWESAATVSVPDGPVVAAVPPPQAVVDTPLVSRAEAADVYDAPDIPTPDAAIIHELAPAALPRRKSLALAGGSVVLAAAVAGYWYTPSSSRRPATVVQAAPAVQIPSPPAPPAEPLSQAEPAVPSPVASADTTSSPPERPKPVPSQSVGDSRASAKHAIQIATFESPARAAQALKQFREAGYQAYSVEMHLRDGKTALAVFLGPYAEHAAADRDLERARQVPGYGTGWVVQVGPSLLPPESRR
jgi:cell division septation protein DedD